MNAPKKRNYLKSFQNLDIRKSNTVRLPGSIDGEIWRQFKYLKSTHGFSDIRDYRSKLVNVGLINISFDSGAEVMYDFDKIYHCNRIFPRRNKVVKINLAEVDLKELNEISVTLGRKIDLYDLISLLMIAGQDNRNGKVKYVDNDKEPIYS